MCGLNVRFPTQRKNSQEEIKILRNYSGSLERMELDRFRFSYTNGYLQEGSMQLEALEMCLLGILAALTPAFLGLSVLLWRDINRANNSS